MRYWLLTSKFLIIGLLLPATVTLTLPREGYSPDLKSAFPTTLMGIASCPETITGRFVLFALSLPSSEETLTLPPFITRPLLDSFISTSVTKHGLVPLFFTTHSNKNAPFIGPPFLKENSPPTIFGFARFRKRTLISPKAVITATTNNIIAPSIAIPAYSVDRNVYSTGAQCQETSFNFSSFLVKVQSAIRNTLL